MRTLQSDTYRLDWYAACRSAETPSIRPKYLARPIIHAPTIAIRGIRRPWGILTSVILSPSGERTRWEKFFLVRHSQRVTFFFDTFADKSETSGLGECLRFPAAWYTYARNFMQSHLVTPRVNVRINYLVGSNA